jgi:hypothetical protein
LPRRVSSGAQKEPVGFLKLGPEDLKLTIRMRTLFEDTDERADREDPEEGRQLSLTLWVVAVVVLIGAAGVYYWVATRKPPEPPPVVVSLDDELQVSQALNRFNGFVKAGNWEEAQTMLSAEARKRLGEEQKTLRESLLGERKDDKVVEALLTTSRSRTPSTARVDCVYLFLDKPQVVMPLTVVKENDRLMIDNWGGA